MEHATPATHRFDGRSPLVLRELSIVRAPGISPGFTLRDLSPQINIVFGPNASGKSTTARAIQSVLWPHQNELRGHHITASFTLDDDTWSVDVNSARVVRDLNGEPADAPLIAPLDDRGRYSLGLPELLASENKPLAEAILNESSGGFDLPSVADDLGYSDTIPQRLESANSVHANLNALRELVAHKNAQDDTLAQREYLAFELEQSLAANQRISSIDQALTYHASLAAENDILAQIDALPQHIRDMDGNETERITNIDRDIADRELEISKIGIEREQWQQRLVATGLADRESAAGELAALQGIQGEIAQLQEHISIVERDLADAVTEREAHNRRLSADLTPDQISNLDSNGLHELIGISAAYESIRARRVARDELELWLGGIQPPENLDTLKQGVQLLETRLGTLNRHEQQTLYGISRWIGTIAGIALGVVGAALAITSSTLWWVLAVVGVLITIAALTIWNSKAARYASEIEQTYASLPLSQPNSWSRVDIEPILHEVRTDLNEALVQQEKVERWQGLTEEREELDAAWVETEERRQAAIDRYGVAPDIHEESLRLISENLAQWQSVDARVHGLEARRERLYADKTLLDARSKTLHMGFGYKDGESTAHLEDIRQRIDNRNLALAHLGDLQDKLHGTLEPSIARIKEERAGIYRSLQLQPGDQSGLDTAISRYQEVAALRKHLVDQQAHSHQLAETLGLEPELRAMSADDLKQAHIQTQQLVDRRSDLEARIRSLDNFQQEAMHSIDYTLALNQLSDARQQLKRDRARIAASTIGELMLTTVRQETRDAALPIVFHRARELFAIITRGKYELQFEPGPPPEFLTYDSSSGNTLALDQLSSGTRVQLLMAVRLAFVENVEIGPRLPVIFDETLGNSDELRAGAIIDAAIDICLRGRQVFYFTAQGEEVARWLQRVELLPAETRPDIRILELADIRREAELTRLPIPAIVHTTSQNIPAPDGFDAATWAAAAKIPSVNPWAPSIGSAHIWHVLPYPDIVYALVNEGITSIGQLHAMQRVNPEHLDAIHPELGKLLPETQVRIELLRNTVQMWRIGHYRPLAPGALADAEMVDTNTLTQLNQIQTEMGNDGQRLLHHLQNMELPLIASKPLDALELWMISEGYIPQGSPIDEADIRKRIISLASPSIRAGWLEVSEIDQLMVMMHSWQ